MNVKKFLENCSDKEYKTFNGIDYLFAKMQDGWTAIFAIDEGNYIPKIQAKDYDHAISWCNMREKTKFNLEKIK